MAKNTLYLCVSLFLLVTAFLAFRHPLFNNDLANTIEAEEQARIRSELEAIEAANSQRFEWRWNNFSDVDASSETYPVVVLRTGFKVLKIEEENALIGWRADFANTSSLNSYDIEMNYALQDQDGFRIANSVQSSEVSMRAQNFRTLQQTVTIPRSDLERLSASTWTVGIGSWESAESESIGNRYERLTKMIVGTEEYPFWISIYLDSMEDNRFFQSIGGKWGAIKAAVESVKANSEENANSIQPVTQ